MAVRNHLSLVKGYGAVALAGVRFVPGASTAAISVQESWGIKSLVRDSTGVYTITLLGRPKGFIALVGHTENDATTYHFVRVESQSDSAYTVTVSHKSVLFANVATGPAASDAVDSISIVVLERAE